MSRRSLNFKRRNGSSLTEVESEVLNQLGDALCPVITAGALSTRTGARLGRRTAAPQTSSERDAAVRYTETIYLSSSNSKMFLVLSILGLWRS